MLVLTACLEKLESADDLTLIPELCRNRREPLSIHVTGIEHFAATSLELFVNDKGKTL